MHILLIEDDPTIAELEKRILVGHEITHVISLHDAINAQIILDYEKSAVFDLIVLDLRLSEKGGAASTADPAQVLQAVNERFKEIPVIVISAYIDNGVINLSSAYNMICVDKSLVANTQSFVNTFNSIMEAAKKMRSTTFLQHMTQDALQLACKPVAETSMERMRAQLYLIAGSTVVLLPWTIIGFTIYSKIVLHDYSPLPYYTETMMFCGLSIAAITGVAPWIMKYFGAKRAK